MHLLLLCHKVLKWYSIDDATQQVQVLVCDVDIKVTPAKKVTIGAISYQILSQCVQLSGYCSWLIAV